MSKPKKKPPKIPAAHSARAKRRLFKSGHAMAAAEALMRAYVDKMASDWPAYVAEFFEVWQTNETSVSEFAETLLQNPHLSFEPETWANLFAPLEPGRLTLFSRLFGRLSFEETERFTDLTATLTDHWKMLGGVLVTKGYCGEKEAAFLLEGVDIALTYARGLVLGEKEPVIFGQYCEVVRRLRGHHKNFRRDGAS